MNADKFVIKPRDIAPAKAALFASDYGSDESDGFIESFGTRPGVRNLFGDKVPDTNGTAAFAV